MKKQMWWKCSQVSLIVAAVASAYGPTVFANDTKTSDRELKDGAYPVALTLSEIQKDLKSSLKIEKGAESEGKINMIVTLTVPYSCGSLFEKAVHVLPATRTVNSSNIATESGGIAIVMKKQVTANKFDDRKDYDPKITFPDAEKCKAGGATRKFVYNLEFSKDTNLKIGVFSTKDMDPLVLQDQSEDMSQVLANTRFVATHQTQSGDRAATQRREQAEQLTRSIEECENMDLSAETLSEFEKKVRLQMSTLKLLGADEEIVDRVEEKHWPIRADFYSAQLATASTDKEIDAVVLKATQMAEKCRATYNTKDSEETLAKCTKAAWELGSAAALRTIEIPGIAGVLKAADLTRAEARLKKVSGSAASNKDYRKAVLDLRIKFASVSMLNNGGKMTPELIELANGKACREAFELSQVPALSRTQAQSIKLSQLNQNASTCSGGWRADLKSLESKTETATLASDFIRAMNALPKQVEEEIKKQQELAKKPLDRSNEAAPLFPSVDGALPGALPAGLSPLAGTGADRANHANPGEITLQNQQGLGGALSISLLPTWNAGAGQPMSAMGVQTQQTQVTRNQANHASLGDASNSNRQTY